MSRSNKGIKNVEVNLISLRDLASDAVSPDIESCTPRAAN